MKQSFCGFCIFMFVICSKALVPDRTSVRQELILHKLSLLYKSNHPFLQEESLRRRTKRQASFPSDDEDIVKLDDGSGDYENTSVVENYPMTSEPVSSSIDWAWYRTNINFLNSIEYSSNLGDYHTAAFQDLANEVMEAIESSLKTELHGYLEATPLMFSMKEDDVIVLIDVGICTTNTIDDVRRALLSLISSGMVGRFRVSENDFRIRQIGIDTQRRECKPGPNLPPSPETNFPFSSSEDTVTTIAPVSSTASTERENISPFTPSTPSTQDNSPLVCGPNEATCNDNLNCIPRSYICDGVSDCADGSDESASCSVASTQCDPTEFLCIGTGICAQKIWRCDGENDCGNNYDELLCSPESSNSRCEATQFECTNRVCISRSYRCDGENDCDDNSDEIGCSSPVIITPPQRFVNASKGSTVTITCEAVGVPDPIISWRLNWGNVPNPPRVTMTSQNGRGTLTIRKVTAADQGAYSCEALSPEGPVLATPDAILIVDNNPVEPTEEISALCPPGEFNISPNISTLCKPCYCFGVTDQCVSSRLEYKEISIVFTDPSDREGVTLEPTDDKIAGGPNTNQPVTENQIRVYPPARELQLIDLSKRFLAAAHYWSLPAQFVGAKINSYGGTLTYSFSYNNSYHMASSPTDNADIILQGKTKTLFYHNRDLHPGPVNKHTVEVTLDESDNWETSEMVPATREDLVEVLSDVGRILIRTVYDDSMLSTGISDVKLQIAGVNNLTTGSEQTGKIAYTVEECDCPEGYTGLSCQECALGYSRITSGPSVGRCVSEEQGDSPTGVCDPGYTGLGCTECAPGYVRHGDRCGLDTGHQCNAAGTAKVILDRECQCKETTQGQYCDQCKAGFYYLPERNQDGCLACLCMGITKNCVSSKWNYTKILLSRIDGNALAITNRNGNPIYDDVVEYEPLQIGSNQAVAIARLNGFPSGVYYWLLPPRFIGNKLTSYGGYLDYIINYSVDSNATPIRHVADVFLVGEQATLVHYSAAPTHPNRNIRHAVALKEGFWRDDSGQIASRQQLLLALSNIKRFLIRASYSSNMGVTKIKDIRLDEAVSRQTGGTQALAVEECTCPSGYAGLSCEECTDGFYRVKGGSFLGTCQPCDCNGHSDICDKETGRCLNCQHNTMGDHCEICRIGYYGNAMSRESNSCLSCPCPALEGRTDQWVVGTCTMNIDGDPVCDRCPTGYAGNRCESCAPGYEKDSLDSSRCRKSVRDQSSCQCDPVGSVNENCDPITGQCVCKPSTTGKKCDQCKPGFFYMSLENPDGGCLPCFCMGITNQCSSSNYKRNEIIANFSDSFGEFSLTQKFHPRDVHEGFEVLNIGRTLSYPRIDLLSREGGAYYWKFPEEFCGDKIVSYGGRLHYTISYLTYGRGNFIDEPDVILRGNEVTLNSNLPQEISPELTSVTFDRSILFRESHWLKSDGRPATREDLLLVLADLDTVLVRASYITTTLRTAISDVVMETASENMMMSEPLYEVEQCECPNGYEGTSCEDCAPGFTRLEGGIYLGLCHLCQCNGHADLCDTETGSCFNCRDNTVGTHCSECAPGFYGDPTLGTSSDCQPCACPGTGSNSFSESCQLDSSDNTLVCTACQEGYAGRRCELCAPGFEGNPTAPGGRCARIRDLLHVNVSPKTLTAKEGTRVSLRCDVTSPTYVSVHWRRAGSNPGRLPQEAIMSDQGRALLLPSLTQALAGTYECVATSRFEKKSDSAVVSIQRESAMIEVRVEEPREVRAREGSQVSFVCTATSKMPAYLVTWTKEGGRLPMSRVTDFEGILHISNVQLSDSGTYICTGSNMYSIDQKSASLLVFRENHMVMPEVEISPGNQSVSEGADAMFYCSATGYPTPTVEWMRDDGRPMTENVHVDGSMLMIPSATIADRSVYRCRASNQHGFVEAAAALDVTVRGEPPYVTVIKTDVRITEGEDAELRCAATGIPEPNFTWTKRKGGLAENEEQLGNTLLITSASRINQDIFTCTATNYFGQHSSQIRVTVKLKEGKPVCRTEPKNVTAYVGTNSTITCVVGGNPPPRVTWEMENGFPMDDNIKVVDQKLYIVGVVATNAGKYVCVATNHKGESRSKMILNVVHKDLPTVSISPSRFLKVKTGQDTSFTCTAPGQDDVDITWLRSDRKLFTGDTILSHGNTKLSFRNISTNEAGGYKCLAGNVVGYKQVSVNITVLQSPIISVAPSTYINVTEGESLTLRCDVIGAPIPSVVWLNTTGREAPRMLTNYRLRSNSYTLRSVHLWHAGSYFCRAINQAGTSKQQVSIEVQQQLVPPSALITPSNVRGTAGSHVKIECEASGTPVPEVSWSKVNGDLPHDSYAEGGILHIYNLSNVSVGSYQCSATNIAGTDSQTALVDLIEPPSMRIEPSNEVYLVLGESINVSCFAVAGTQPITMSWSGDLEFTHTFSILNFVDFQPERDAGTYTCTGANAAGSTSVTLAVRNLDVPTVRLSSNQVTTLVGRSVTFQCDVDAANGKAAVEITWRSLDRLEMDIDRTEILDGLLRIDDVELEDEGQYECIATNKAGSASAVGFLRVQVPPSVEISLEQSSTILKEDDSLTISCIATGIPEPSVQLKKDDVELTIDKHGRHFIEHVMLSETGQYVCVAANDAGEARAGRTIQVLKPPVASIEVTKIQVRSGDNLAVKCSVEGLPLPNVTWTKESGKMPMLVAITDGQLNIDKILVKDAGIYSCTATNAAGTGSASVRIDVNAYLPYFTQTPLSYMAVRLSDNQFYAGFNITVSFRPITLNGLILYSYSRNSDFISLSLAGGIVEFRFNVGSGTVTIHSQSSVELDRWHTVKVSRVQRSGQLQLDSNPVVKGKAPGEFRALELSSHLYVGGIPSSIVLPHSLQALGSDSGFYGCISQIDLGHGLLDLGGSRDIVERFGVVRCKTCSSDEENFPCLNSATCIETHRNKTGYSCNCTNGYVGKNCQFDSEHLCAKGACNRQGSCQIDLDTDLGYTCTCNRFYTGPQCFTPITTTTRAPVRTRPRLIGPFARGKVIVRPIEEDFDLLDVSNVDPSDKSSASISPSGVAHESDSEAISFNQNSYVFSDVLRASDLKRTDISLRIRRRTYADGLILYVGESSRRSTFLSLTIRNNALEYRFNTGTDTAILRAPASAVGVGSWHTIRIRRKKNRGRLEVDGKTVARARSSGPEDLFLEGSFYIGGVRFWEFIPEKLNIREGFSGCVESLQINGEDFSINQLFTKKNTGLCRVLVSTSTAAGIEDRVLEPTKPRYSSRFTGTSYASFPRSSFDHDQNAEQISIQFKTTEPYGLILYHGENLVAELKKLSQSRHRRRHKLRRARKKDYITLGVQESFLVYSFDLGGGVGRARSRFPVSDGLLHTARIMRRGSLVLMWMDDVPVPVATQSPESHTVANTPGRLYVGGAPDVIFATAGRYTAGFNGCIKDVRLTSITSSRLNELGSGYLNDASTSPLDFSRSGTLERINLRNCRNTH